MHIVLGNYGLLGYAGVAQPDGVKGVRLEQTVTSKAEVITWLKRSLEDVKTARAAAKPADLQRKVKIMGQEADVDGIHLRICPATNTWANWWRMRE